MAAWQHASAQRRRSSDNLCGLLPLAEWDIARYVRSGRLRLVLEDQTPTRADVYAVYPQQLHLSARVRSLIDFLVERFKHIDHLEEPESTRE
ncbi:LysR substrate binding domain-containing protein [Pseudomonas sp. 478]|nr:LysR substrate binding domain-containing protein [Pseudomonas sp. 478]TCV39204.1 LysR substrate binding domain-containing protein [Pseudomonas sp. 460]